MCDDLRLTWNYIGGIFLDLELICDDLRTTSECSAHIEVQSSHSGMIPHHRKDDSIKYFMG